MRALASLPLLCALATAALADTAALDAVAQHVAARADAPELSPRARRALTKLAPRLAAGDAAGARDDFAKLAAAARAAHGPLSGDAEFAGLVDAALDEAASTLAVAGSDVIQVLVLLDPGRRRTALERRSATAAGLRERYLDQRAAGSSGLAVGRRAARAYDACLRRARRDVEKQNSRAATWSIVFRELGGALLGVWADDDPVQPSVYVVGARDASQEPTFLRLAGEAWVRLPAAVDADLWWVAGVPGTGGPAGAVWTCGTGGTVIRHAPQTGASEDLSVPGVEHTLFGIWGAADDDVWAVGGGPAAGGGGEPVARHWDGSEWEAATLPQSAAARVLYKVWGTAADDVWACGSGGVLLHFDGEAWSDVPSGTNATLLTLHGRPGSGIPMAAVGGPGVDATITERAGPNGFRPVALPNGLESLNGIAFDGSGDAYAAGVYGTVLRREGGTWTQVADAPTPGGLDHHAVAIDGAGGAWFAGGSLNGALDRGFLLHHGSRAVPTDVVRAASLRREVAPLLSARCATIGCHVEPFANEGLDLLTPESVRGQTRNVPSHQSPLLRVVPGRPSQSYLWHKLRGTQAGVGGSGSRMPNSTGLSPEELELVRAWILAGALDD